jgi:hypothetical protein
VIDSGWTPVFLGIIAFAVLVMAVLQVGMVVYGARLARRVTQLADRVEHQVTPVFATLQTIGADAARATALAAAQMERADRLFADVSQRIQDTTVILQESVVAPAREGAAVVAGVRAAIAALRDVRSGPPRRAGRADEDDPLFIG